MDWESARVHLDPDPLLRTFYVFDTDEADWQRVLDFIRDGPWRLVFSVGWQEQPLPDDVRNIFSMRDLAGPNLTIAWGGLDIRCQFFDPALIEFDFDASEVDSEERLAGVLDFLRALGRITGKVAVLTYESWPECPIYRVDPTSDSVEFVGSSPFR